MAGIVYKDYLPSVTPTPDKLNFLETTVFKVSLHETIRNDDF